MPSLEQSRKTELTQQQSRVLTTRQQLGLELLHLPMQALEARLAEEFSANPVLEEGAGDFISGDADMPGSTSGRDEDPDDYESNYYEDAADRVDGDNWAQNPPVLPGENFDGTDRKMELMGNSPTPPPELSELLLIELDTSDLPAAKKLLAEEIISSLDNDGYLRVSLADLAMSCDAELDELADALKLVQEIAPPGVGARDLGECLKLQLERSGKLTPLLEKIISGGLEDVAEGDLKKLAKRFSVSVNEVEEALGILRTLDPSPGSREIRREESEIFPELEIEKAPGGKWQVNQLRENFRRVGISRFYEKLSEDASLSVDDRKYLNEKLARARDIVKSLEMRDSTLLQLGRVIVDHQEGFLEKGVSGLRSFTMREAAEALDLSESTISRAAADKYVRTPHGVFPLRFFFSSGGGEGEDKLAGRAVMEKIRQIIAAENPLKPLSDDRIAAILEQDGVKIARRTVAKYRDILKIPSASVRRIGSRR